MVEIARLLAIDQIETAKGVNQIRSLKRPGETRWGSHLGSISSLMHMFNPVRVVLGRSSWLLTIVWCGPFFWSTKIYLSTMLRYV